MSFVNNKKTVSFRGATLMLLIKQNITSKRFERSVTFTRDILNLLGLLFADDTVFIADTLEDCNQALTHRIFVVIRNYH